MSERSSSEQHEVDKPSEELTTQRAQFKDQVFELSEKGERWESAEDNESGKSTSYYLPDGRSVRAYTSYVGGLLDGCGIEVNEAAIDDNNQPYDLTTHYYWSVDGSVSKTFSTSKDKELEIPPLFPSDVSETAIAERAELVAQSEHWSKGYFAGKDLDDETRVEEADESEMKEALGILKQAKEAPLQGT